MSSYQLSTENSVNSHSLGLCLDLGRQSNGRGLGVPTAWYCHDRDLGLCSRGRRVDSPRYRGLIRGLQSLSLNVLIKFYF